MSESIIFKYANDISMNRKSNSARSVTTGGYARTHKLGPSLLSLDVELPILSEEQYLEVENELFSIDDGIEFLTVNLSSNNGNNIMNTATVPLKTGETQIKVMKDSHSVLNEFILVNLQPSTNNIFKVGDFIQFNNHDKVYQIFKPRGITGTQFSSTVGGTCKIRLSTPLITSIGINPSAASFGSKRYYHHIQGGGDLSENVTFSWTVGSGATSSGLFTLNDTVTGNAYVLSDGTNAVINIPQGYDTALEIAQLITAAKNGTTNYSGLSVAQRAQNNKISEIISDVDYINTSSFSIDFSVTNVRPELTTPSRDTGQSLHSPVTNTTLTNPFRDGLITIKNPDNTTAKDSSGNDLTITIPKANVQGDDVYNYLKNTIMATNSTHPIKTDGIWYTISGGTYPENWNTPLQDSSGRFIVQWGYAYDGCTIEYTTPTASVATTYNAYNFTEDVVATLGTNLITIENATETYTAGEYLQPTNRFIEAIYGQKILSVATSGTTTTINFDTTYNAVTTGWTTNTKISKHDADALSSSIGFIKEAYIFEDADLSTSSANVLMGNDVNIKLMLTNKPGVTIIPKDENKNLYKYNSFKFQEVL
jgi:hypothetical protein